MEKVTIAFDDKYVIYYPSRKKIVDDMTDLLDTIVDEEEGWELTEDLLYFLLGRTDEFYWRVDVNNTDTVWITAVPENIKTRYDNYQKVTLENDLYNQWNMLTAKEID